MIPWPVSREALPRLTTAGCRRRSRDRSGPGWITGCSQLSTDSATASAGKGKRFDPDKGLRYSLERVSTPIDTEWLTANIMPYVQPTCSGIYG